MLGPVYRKALGAARRAAGPAGIKPMRGVEAEGRRSRPADLGGLPGFGHAGAGAGLHEGVFVARDVLVADLALAFLFEPDLPHEIAGKARHPAAPFDIGIDGVAHLPRPVFVMPDADHAGIALQQLGTEMQVGLADDVEPVALGLGPGHDMPLEAGPAGRHVFLAVAIGIGPLHVGIARFGIDRRRIEQHGTRRIRWQAHEALGKRPLKAEHRRETITLRAAIALIVVGAAPVVVGRPGGGGGDQQQTAFARLAGPRPDDEDVLVHVRAPGLVRDRAADDIAARRP